MSILINRSTRVLVQGITGQEGLLHTHQMLEYGTNVVAGVTPGRGGEWVDGKIPVFDTVKNAVEMTGADTSILFIPARHATDAMVEAVDGGIQTVVCVTEGIPAQDVVRVLCYARQKGARIIGPNSPGMISPGEASIGIIPNHISLPGNTGIVSRSGMLMFHALNLLKKTGFGVSSCVGVGGDTIVGTSFVEILTLFEEDPYTDQIILLGEIGGEEEERAAAFITSSMTKPVIGYIAGLMAPAGKRFGHAGAIIEGEEGLAQKKVKALEAAGVRMARHIEEISTLITRD